MTREVKIKQVVEYNGHSLRDNGGVSLTFKVRYADLADTVKLMQLLNNDIQITCKVGDEKPKRLGIFKIKNISIDGDGESKIKFSGIKDYIEIDNLNHLPLQDDPTTKSFVVMYTSEIELGDDDVE